MGITLKFDERLMIAISRIAVVYDSERSYVFKVNAGKAGKTKEVFGAKGSTSVIVISCIKPIYVIITAGQMKIYPGVSVIGEDSKYK